MIAGVHVAAHAVLGGVQPDEFHVGRLVKYVDCRLEAVVNAGGVGDEAHALALEGGEIHVAEHLDAGLHGLCAEGEGCADCGD